MCDYSLNTTKTRDARVGDTLETKSFGTGTRGFTDPSAPASEGPIAVCVRPGTEIAFADPIALQTIAFAGPIAPQTTPSEQLLHRTAIFRQVDKDNKLTHHDALEMPDGRIVKLNDLAERQTARVLQLPASPKTEAEVQEQTRLDVHG